MSGFTDYGSLAISLGALGLGAYNMQKNLDSAKDTARLDLEKTELQRQVTAHSREVATLNRLRPFFRWNDDVIDLFDEVQSDLDDRKAKGDGHALAVVASCRRIVMRGSMLGDAAEKSSDVVKQELKSVIDDVKLIMAMYIKINLQGRNFFTEVHKIQRRCLQSLASVSRLLTK